MMTNEQPKQASSAGEVPEWAVKRASELANADGNYYDAFARYIAAHEQPPVDPLLIEAEGLAHQYANGPWRAQDLALAALRRGMELAELRQRGVTAEPK